MTKILTKRRWREVRKALISAAGIGSELLAQGVLHGDTAHYVSVAIGIVTVALVHQVPNAQPVD